MGLLDFESQTTTISDENQPKIPSGEVETMNLTMSEVKYAAEQLPHYVFDELGEEIAKKILVGSGDLKMCVGDALITIVPETKTVILPINHGPLVERFLRSPWRDAEHDSSFLTLQLKPRETEPSRYGMGSIDEVDIPEEGEVYEGDIDRTNIYNSDTDSFSIAETKNDPNVTHRFFKNGPQSGETRGGIGAVEEEAKRYAMSPEDEIVIKEEQENLFKSEIITPDENLISKVMKGDSSLAIEFVKPIIPVVKDAVNRFNRRHNFPIYDIISPSDIATSLLYKGKQESLRKELKPNLTPLVLSPSLCVLRGYRGFLEDTLVVAKTKKGWEAEFFEPSRNRHLSTRIDSWLQEKSERS